MPVTMAHRLAAVRRGPHVSRVLWQRLLWWYFLLFQRHRHRRLILEEVAGQSVLVLPEVFNPKLFHSGEFLAETLSARLIPPGSIVLDMGTGSGVAALFAAQWARRVVAVDINPAAVRCTRINALLHGIEDRIEARQGDLFDPVRGERFDVVLFNPPYLRGEPRDILERALWAKDVVERFAAGLRDQLARDGHALVVLSDKGDLQDFLAAFQLHGFVAEVVATCHLLTETLEVYRIYASDTTCHVKRT